MVRKADVQKCCIQLSERDSIALIRALNGDDAYSIKTRKRTVKMTIEDHLVLMTVSSNSCDE